MVFVRGHESQIAITCLIPVYCRQVKTTHAHSWTWQRSIIKKIPQLPLPPTAIHSSLSRERARECEIIVITSVAIFHRRYALASCWLWARMPLGVQVRCKHASGPLWFIFTHICTDLPFIQIHFGRRNSPRCVCVCAPGARDAMQTSCSAKWITHNLIKRYYYVVRHIANNIWPLYHRRVH